jgi:hypothetical protein
LVSVEVAFFVVVLAFSFTVSTASSDASEAVAVAPSAGFCGAGWEL